MNKLSRLLMVFWLAGLSVLGTRCVALTTTYTLTAPPDDVSVTISPGGSTTPDWPTQLLDSHVGTENNAGVVFRNEANNTIFVDSNALQVSNAPVLSGVIAWADVRYNGPTDEPFIEFDFSSWIGGSVQELQFDFALTSPVPGIAMTAYDSNGNTGTLTSPASSFTYGDGQQGAQGHATLTPTGSLSDITRVRFGFADEDFAGLQFGFDNLVISNGQSANFGGDSAIDGADLAAWTTAFGSGNGADADGDGDTDGQDYLIWQTEYTGPSSLSGSTSVPEPNSILLCFVLVVVASATSVARGHSR